MLCVAITQGVSRCSTCVPSHEVSDTSSLVSCMCCDISELGLFVVELSINDLQEESCSDRPARQRGGGDSII